MEETDHVICVGMFHTALSWGRESRWCLGHTQLPGCQNQGRIVTVRGHLPLLWELSVPFRSGKSGKVRRTVKGPEPQVMCKAGLSARPAQGTPVLAPVSSQRRSHPKAAQLSWGKLFSYEHLELSLLQLLHRETCPFPEHPAGLWAFPRGTRKPLGNL